MKQAKKVICAFLMGLTLVMSVPAIASAQTVYFKGYAVAWDHGRKLGVYSYSNVQTHRFTHGATANTTWSGWKKPGVLAKAEQFVGTGTAEAYWDCKED